MKKQSLVFVAVAVILAAAVLASARLFAASGPSSASASSAAGPKPCSPPDAALYGHIKSLTPKGDHFQMRFDPARFLSGAEASRAKLADTGTSDVPNDNYVVEDGHRLLTYLVPTTAHITVLSRTGELVGSGFPSTAITVPQLAQLVKGEEPVELAESLESGFWMHANIDTVCSLEQQYLP